MSWRGLGLFPSPRSLMGLQGRGPCPLPYRPICSTHCRDKGRFTPNPAAALHSVSFPRATPPCAHLLGRRQTKQTDKDKQANKPTDNQTDRQTKQTETKRTKTQDAWRYQYGTEGILPCHGRCAWYPNFLLSQILIGDSWAKLQAGQFLPDPCS